MDPTLLRKPKKSKHRSKHKSENPTDRKDKKRKRHVSPTDIEDEDCRMNTITKKTRKNDESLTNSPYYFKTASLYLALPPKYSFYPEKTFKHLLQSSSGLSSEQAAHLRSLSPIYGVEKHHLEPLLMRFFEPVDGVVIAYDNIRFETHTAKIISESPYAHVWTTVDMLVWRPRKGMVLQGWVNLQSASHIGLLVENMWNVSIPVAEIPNDWQYNGGVSSESLLQPDEMELQGNSAHGCWVTSNGDRVGGQLRFQVKSVEADGNIFLVNGSLQDRAVIDSATIPTVSQSLKDN
ncbi:hypothetical protein EDC01DRAFT_198169 [Geopyxis carbonaria]|nr:hypothetical protein EDC01DRAFT_198169 [Geopyxis carbonaria]